MTEQLKRTALNAEHQALGARMVPFAGWELPVQFSGILKEHHAVRTHMGLFDVSHMGRLELQGPGAVALLQRALTIDVSNLRPGRARYGLLCREDGGIIDDLITYRLGPERFLVVCNAAHRDLVIGCFKGLVSSIPGRLEFTDTTEQTVMLALQGPSASSAVERLCPEGASHLARYACVESTVQGIPVLVARTGYTGEDGFEFVCPSSQGIALWRSLTALGAMPCGLGARDVLRLEAGYLLSGTDFATSTNPFEADLGRFVHLHKREDFLGRTALEAFQGQVLGRRLIAFQTEERSVVPRHGHPLLHNGRDVGRVTSGSYSPTLDRNIGLGYVASVLAEPGTKLEAEVRGKRVPVVVAARPLYQGSASK